METIVLTGNKNTGKTGTMYFVYEKLVLAGWKSNNHKHIGAIGQRDFSDVLSDNGKKIVVFTMGDQGTDVEKEFKEAFDWSKKNSIDLFICPCNTNAEGIKNYIDNNNPIVIEKSKENTFMTKFEVNAYDGYQILSNIQKIIYE